MNRLYAFNSAINQSIVHIEQPQVLLENTCRIAIDIGGFENAWIDIIEPTTNERNRQVQLGFHPLAHSQNRTFSEEPLAEVALKTNAYALSNDIENDVLMRKVKKTLLAKGIHSQIDLPIRKGEKIIGILGLQSSRKHFFDEQEIALLLEAVGDISFALEIFENNKLHRETELLVQYNEKRFRSLIERSPDMKSLATAEGKFIYGSPSITKILGYRSEDFIGKSVFDLIHPEDRKAFDRKRRMILKKHGASFDFQQRRRHKNGHWVWCEGTLTNWLHEPGIEALVSNFRDITAKKIAEQQREFDANNTYALINNTKDMMWSVDKELRLISSNNRFNEVVQLVRGKPMLPGDHILHGANPETVDLYQTFYDRALSGEAFSEITKLTLPQKRWLEVSFYPIRQEGEVVGTACHSRDITEFINLELELQKKLREISDYKYALDEASIVAITDQRGIIRHVNDNFCRISKYSRQELIGQDHRIINSGYHSKAFIKEIWKTIANGKIWKGEIKNRAKDGNFYWVDTTIVPFLDERRKPYQYIAIRSDISERKKVEAQLRKSEEFSREVLNSLSAHIAVIDSLGEIVAVNEAWRRFGIENGGARYIHSDQRQNYFKVCENSYANGDLAAADVLHGLKEVMAKRWPDFYHEYSCNSSKEERWFAMTTRPFQGEESMIVVAHDNISQRKFVEEKLIRQNKELEKTNFELDRFVYSVSHDLRSPLTAILGLLSFIEEESQEHETLQHVKMIRERVSHLDQFIKSILDYSRTNRIAPVIEKIDLSGFIHNIVESLSNIKEAENITFTLEIDQSQPLPAMQYLHVNTK